MAVVRCGLAELKPGALVDLEKSFNSTQEMIKGLGGSLDKKFGAMGTIMKSIVDQNASLNAENLELKKSLTEISTRIEKVENTSQGSKSTKTVRQVERFQKSEDEVSTTGKTVYSLSDAGQRRMLLTEMTNIAVEARNNNTPNLAIEKAASQLELAKSMSRDILPLLRSRNIEVTE